jgi:hypothetical protein
MTHYIIEGETAYAMTLKKNKFIQISKMVLNQAGLR